MKDLNKETISTLNDLIEACRDGARGYKTAADEAKDAELASLFHRYAAQREGFVGELQKTVRGLGGDPDQSGSVTGKLHRGWMDVKSAVSSHDAHAILAECERGEDAAVKAYRQASEKDLAPPARAATLRQMAAVQAAHDDIRDRRDRLAAVSKP